MIHFFMDKATQKNYVEFEENFEEIIKNRVAQLGMESLVINR